MSHRRENKQAAGPSSRAARRTPDVSPTHQHTPVPSANGSLHAPPLFTSSSSSPSSWPSSLTARPASSSTPSYLANPLAPRPLPPRVDAIPIAADFADPATLNVLLLHNPYKRFVSVRLASTSSLVQQKPAASQAAAGAADATLDIGVIPIGAPRIVNLEIHLHRPEPISLIDVSFICEPSSQNVIALLTDLPLSVRAGEPTLVRVEIQPDDKPGAIDPIMAVFEFEGPRTGNAIMWQTSGFRIGSIIKGMKRAEFSFDLFLDAKPYIPQGLIDYVRSQPAGTVTIPHDLILPRLRAPWYLGLPDSQSARLHIHGLNQLPDVTSVPNAAARFIALVDAEEQYQRQTAAEYTLYTQNLNIQLYREDVDSYIAGKFCLGACSIIQFLLDLLTVQQ